MSLLFNALLPGLRSDLVRAREVEDDMGPGGELISGSLVLTASRRLLVGLLLLI